MFNLFLFFTRHILKSLWWTETVRGGKNCRWHSNPSPASSFKWQRRGGR